MERARQWPAGSRLHVCFVNLSFGENSAGGVMHHMVALSKALRDYDVAVTVICPAYGEPWRYVHDGIIDVIGIREAWIDWKLAPAMVGFGRRCERALLELHRDRPIDVVHLHDRPPFIGAARAGHRLHVPVIYTAHSCLHAGAPQYHPAARFISRLLERSIARSGVPIIAVSEWTRDCMIGLGTQPERITTITNGVDVDAFSYGIEEGRNREEVLFVGRLDQEKGLDVLLNAFALLVPTSTRPPRLTLIGEGVLRPHYEKLARQLGIADRVHFAGRQIGGPLIEAYHRAAVCVLPSRREPFALVMLEAMACGAPFIGSTVGGVVEAVTHETTGLLVPPQTPHLLAAAIRRLIDDRALARRLSENARHMVEQRYSWQEIAEQTMAVYDASLTETRGVEVA